MCSSDLKPLYAQYQQEQTQAKRAPEDLMMEHLGMKMPEAIKTPTQTRVDEFGRITEETRATLRELGPIVDKHIDPILDALYSHVLKWSHLKAMFGTEARINTKSH